MFIKDSSLIHDNIVHGFFGKGGGVSGGIHESLNCGFGTQDKADNVEKNRRIVCEALGVGILLNLYQIHSSECVTVREPWEINARPEADALVTDVSGIGLGILTADCAPILFYGQKQDGSSVIGAAHAGWKGALKGVLENTIAAMEGLGAQRETMRAAIGPCIRQESYEVSNDFMEPFLVQSDANRQFFQGRGESHQMFDLPGYIIHLLMRAGVPDISRNGMDTYFNEMDYFSYRRSVHKGEPDYGRQISVIAIKNG